MSGTTLMELDPPTPIINHESAPETRSQANMMEPALQLRFTPPKCVKLATKVNHYSMASLKSTVLTQRERKVPVGVKKRPGL